MNFQQLRSVRETVRCGFILTRLAIRRGAWLRGYAYRFIETFVPTLTRDVVEKVVNELQAVN